MKIYTMSTAESNDNCYFDVKDTNGSVLDHFMLGVPVARFEKGYPFIMKAQSFFNKSNFNTYDFFEPTMAFPVFSIRAAGALREKVSSQMTFFPAKVDVNGSLYEVFAGVVLNRKSVFERVGDYEVRVRDGVVIGDDDFIVRDLDNPQFFFATESMRLLCDSLRLNILFKNFSMMK